MVQGHALPIADFTSANLSQSRNMPQSISVDAWHERMLIAEERLIQSLIDEQDALLTDQDYEVWHDTHFPRIRKILADSGDYEWKEFDNDPDYRDRVLDTDTHLIMDMPHLNPEYF